MLIDGRDVTGVDLDSLRSQVAYVFQEHVLLSASIRDNLLLAKPDASDDDIVRALEGAACMGFIRDLPEASTPSSANRGIRSPSASSSACASPEG